MLVGLAGLLAGYDGHFDFKSGSEYPEGIPYVAMRVLLAMFGVAMVPLGWYTAVELGMSKRGCHIVALMVLLGNSYFHGRGGMLMPADTFQTSPGFASLGSFYWIQCCFFSLSLLCIA